MIICNAYNYIITCALLTLLMACSQEEITEETTEHKKVEQVEINLDNYIPEKPKLIEIPPISDHPHDGTLKNKPKPSFPARAEKSGHCFFILNISEIGEVENIESLKCSDDTFVKHTKQKLFQWVFHPKKDENGNNVAFTVGPQKISYRLTDLDGNVIPE